MPEELSSQSSSGVEVSTNVDAVDSQVTAESRSEVHRLGRYVILGKLGQGGMGTVLRAFDEKLDRQIAVKVLKRELAETHTRRLRREAKAMAQLSHPNVVQVYEVGEVEGQTYVAMELVAGKTPREWLQQEPKPSWRDCVRMFVQLGEGLAAAHERGLVHRDFKPGNAVIDSRGRPRVLDFGLVRQEQEAGLPSPSVLKARAERSASALEGEPLTEHGTLLGTPGYMPVEQMNGQPADMRSDQFSFCVSLYEALYGERPFPGTTVPALMVAMQAEDIRPAPKGSKVPIALRKILLRGLALRPQDRWPSMNALLAQLRPLASPRRVQWTVLGLSTGLVALGIGLWQQAYAGAPCTGAEALASETWNDTQREALRTALEGTGLNYAQDTWSLVRAELDGYRDRWIEQHTDACEATTVRGEQSAEMLDLRMACLHRARQELGAVVSVLANADAEVMGEVPRLISGLPPLSMCADVDALSSDDLVPEDPAQAEEVNELRGRLAELRYLGRAGRYDEALAGLEPLMERSERSNHAPLLAEVALLRGEMLGRLARPEEAETALRLSLSLAIEAGAHQTALEAIVELAPVVGTQLSRPKEVHGLTSMGMSLARRWAVSDETVAALHRSVGLLLTSMGDPAKATAEHRHAIEILSRAEDINHIQLLAARLSLAAALCDAGTCKPAEEIQREVLERYVEILGPRHPEVAHVHMLLGRSLFYQGRPADAEVEIRRALELLERALGPEHPDVAEAMDQLGVSLFDQARYDEAEQAYQRALRVRSSDRGAPDPRVVNILNNLAQVHFRRGELGEAAEMVRRALALSIELRGPEHPDVGRQRNNLALILKAAGRLNEAAVELRRTIDIYEKSLGSDHPRIGTAALNLGNLLQSQHRMDEALELYRRASTVMEASLGPDHPRLGIVYSSIGVLQLRRDELGEAEHYCRRALSIYEGNLPQDHPDLGTPLSCLGQILLARGQYQSARDHYVRALALGAEQDQSVGPRPEIRFGYAQALWKIGEHDEALREAETALAFAQASGLPSSDEPIIEEMKAWLEARRPSSAVH